MANVIYFDIFFYIASITQKESVREISQPPPAVRKPTGVQYFRVARAMFIIWSVDSQTESNNNEKKQTWNTRVCADFLK